MTPDGAVIAGGAYRVFRAALLLCACCILVTAFALAQQQAPITVTLSPAATSIRWTLGSTLHTVHGTFKLKSGEVRIDPTTGDVSGTIIVDATSGESGDSARDRHMHQAVLESTQYPAITFRPQHVNGKIDLNTAGSITVDGVLNLHGGDHPLRITVNVRPQGTGVALATQFNVPYVAWGMKDPSKAFLHVDKQVALEVEATFTAPSERSPAKAILHPGEVHTAQ